MGPFRDENGFRLTRMLAVAILVVGCVAGYADVMTTVVCTLILADWKIKL